MGSLLTHIDSWTLGRLGTPAAQYAEFIFFISVLVAGVVILEKILYQFASRPASRTNVRLDWNEEQNRFKAMMIGFFFLLFLWVGTSFQTPVLDWQMLWSDSLSYSLGCFIILLIIALYLFRGSFFFRPAIVGVGLGLLFLVPIVGRGLETAMNNILDPGPVSFHQELVTDKFMILGGRRRILLIHSWRPGRDFETLDVSRAFYDQVLPKRR